MATNEPPPPPTPPGGGPPPPPPPGTPGGYGGYGDTPPPYGGSGGGYGQPPAPGGYGGAPAPHPSGGQPATLGPRFLARLIDFVLYFIITLVLGAILGIILVAGDSTSLDRGGLGTGGSSVFNLVSTVLSTAIVLAYFSLLESSRGQTLGKMVMKLVVVAPEGGHPTLVQALKRNSWLAISLVGVLGVLGSALSGLLTLGAIILIVIGISGDTARRQSFFDKLGGDLQVLKTG